MVVEDWISLREFARRREVALSAVQKAIDSGRVTAVRRDEAGHLAGIEFHRATAEWNRHTDPVAAAKSGKVLGASISPLESAAITIAAAAAAGAGAAMAGVGAERSAGGSLPLPAMPSDRANAADAAMSRGAAAVASGGAVSGAASGKGADQDDYYTHRAVREKFAALAAEREHLEALGTLVSAEEVARVAGQRYRAIRDKLLNIADRQAPILAAEKEPAAVHAILTAEIKRVLHELSDDAESEVARGAEERLAA